MKLAAAAILSLVAIATYASPAAYSENQVSAEYSAANAPVIVHLEKRTGGRPGFLERIEEIQKSVGYQDQQDRYLKPLQTVEGENHNSDNTRGFEEGRGPNRLGSVHERKVDSEPAVELVQDDYFDEQSDDEQSEDETLPREKRPPR
ncbi:hypothetical protein BASA60_003460 [Batrachochytrium salamandrivorans]|nr:hypothetical protein BASA60_003460 [Batrachochytrium salamandrivorans]